MGNGKSNEVVAAVDLGSNSFHLVLGRLVNGSLQILDRLRESVRLGAGLDESLNLDEEVQERALACLARFGERLRDVPGPQVRAVGTSALRQARNRRRFLDRAQAALGHRVEIIRGHEEARLIHLGVAQALVGQPGRRLVVDIGGGSTECIIGEGQDALRTDSLHMGCVNYSRKYFPKGRLDREQFKKAEIAARREIRSLARPFLNLGFETAIGASGTITTIGDIVNELGFCRSGITWGSLKKLRKLVTAAGRIEDLVLPGLKPDRLPVFPGGLAILRGIFDGLRLSEMAVSQGALREGVLFDLAGRLRHEDGRDVAIRHFAERHHVDLAQASRVERTALRLFDQIQKAWKLDPESDRDLLKWAARVHEVGMVVDYGGYHKHGAYLIEHSDLPGFSADDQLELSILVHGHRRRLDRAVVAELPKDRAERILELVLLLRLSVVMNRGRTTRRISRLDVEANPDGLAVGFPEGWLDRHPLTRADLEEEREFLKGAGFSIDIR